MNMDMDMDVDVDVDELAKELAGGARWCCYYCCSR